MLYLDYAASTPLRPSALQVLKTSFEEDFANPSSAHKLGKGLYYRIEICRQGFLEFLDAHAQDPLIFTASATESNNSIIQGIPLNQGDSMMLSQADHPSITVPAGKRKELLKQANIHPDINIIDIPLHNDGSVDETGLLNRLDNSVKLLLLSHVNNHSGVLTDVEELSQKVKQKNPAIHIHIDAAQSFGKIPLSLKNGAIDSVSIASHKIGGPKGVAALYLRRAIQFSPLLHGGGQEHGFRSSTQAAPLIFSFYEAARAAMASLQPAWEHVSKIYRATQDRLQKEMDIIDFPFAKTSSPYILTFLFHGIPSDIILRHLEQKGIMISTSSACSSKIKGINPVFTALHIPSQSHKFVLRVSFSEKTSMDDIEMFCSALAETYRGLKLYLFKR